MAFWDAPIVDRNSELSEESVLKVKTLFTRKNGFLLRDEAPDYGIDQDIELISDEGGATSHRFPIQIKSSRKIETLSSNGTRYASVDFKTSRLGYLCRRPPAYGIIVIYDEGTENAYYDYVEEIVTRLSLERENDEWHKQEKVRIHIPLVPLTFATIRCIHQKMTNRFADNDRMLVNHGARYNIPILIDKDPSGNFDFDDESQIVDFLLKYGMALLRREEFSLVQDFLEALPSKLVSQTKELFHIGAIAYLQTGSLIEAEYYFARCSQIIDQYDETHVFLLSLLRCAFDLQKGNVDIDHFRKQLKELNGKSPDEYVNLSIEITIIHSEFLGKNRVNEVGVHVLNSIHAMFEKIKSANVGARNQVKLILLNAQNLFRYGLDLLIIDGGKMALQEQLKLQIPDQEKVSRIENFISIISNATNIVFGIYSHSKNVQDTWTTATSASYIGDFFRRTSHQEILISPPHLIHHLDSETTRSYEVNLALCYEASDLFLKMQLPRDRHRVLICAYEIQMVYKIRFDKPVGPRSLEDLEALISELGRDEELPEFRSEVAASYSKLAGFDTGPTDWAKLPEDRIETTAIRIQNALGVPHARLPNIIAEINVIRTFYRECTNPDIEILFDVKHEESIETRYSNKPRFYLRNKKSGITTPWTSDINDVLKQFMTS